MEVSTLNNCEFTLFPSLRRGKRTKGAKPQPTKTNGKKAPATTPVDAHLLVKRLNTRTFVRNRNFDLKPNEACFVDYETKVRLGIGASLDFSKPRVKKQLQRMEIGETITIGSDNAFFEYCDEDTSPAHVQLTKTSSDSFILKDLNSYWGTTVLKNVDDSTLFYEPVIMTSGTKYPVDMRASVKFSGFEEKDLNSIKGITKLHEAEKMVVRAGDLERSDDVLASLFEYTTPMFSIERRNDQYYITPLNNKGLGTCFPRSTNYKEHCEQEAANPVITVLKPAKQQEEADVSALTPNKQDSKIIKPVSYSETIFEEEKEPVTQEISRKIVKQDVEYTCKITYLDGTMHKADFKATQKRPDGSISRIISKTYRNEDIAKRIPDFVLSAFPLELTGSDSQEYAISG